MKILVIGSYKEQDSALEFEAFKTACNNIGTWLHSKYSIIVAGSMPPTADHYVLQSIQRDFDTTKRCNIRVYSANNDDTQMKLSSDSPALNQFLNEHQLIQRFADTRSYILVHLQAVKDAKLIVVIGGGKDTADICALAERFGKRILAIPHYKGEGGERYKELQHEYKKIFSADDLFFLSNSDFTSKGDEGNFLKIVDKIAKRRFMDYLQLPTNSCSLLFIVLSMLCGWLFTQYYFDYRKENILYISMFVSSVTIGIIASLSKFTLFNINELSRYDEVNALGKAVTFGLSTGSGVALTTTSIAAFVINDSTIYSSHPAIVMRAIFVTMLISFLVVFGQNLAGIKKIIDFIKKTIK